MNPTDPNNADPWDRAVAARLARLQSLPVETARLAAAVEARVPRPAARPSRNRLFLKPLRAVAAIIALLASVSVALFLANSRPAAASPAQMARFHENMVSGQAPAVRVDSIEAANRALSLEHPQCPSLPNLPAEHVMACCMNSVKDKKVACVLLQREGVPVSLMVARSQDMRAPKTPATRRDGVRYHVQASGKLNMVMTERHGRWVCLIADLPPDRLMDLATELKF